MNWRWVQLRKIEISGKKYYETYFQGNAGDIFSDWREAEHYKRKLFNQVKRHEQSTKAH